MSGSAATADRGPQAQSCQARSHPGIVLNEHYEGEMCYSTRSAAAGRASCRSASDRLIVRAGRIVG